MANDTHRDHRARMRKRFLDHGLDNFADHEVLELLLYYGLSRGDVNPLAHALMEDFNSLAGVLEASTEDLCKVSGGGENIATLLHLMPSLFQRYQLSKVSEKQYDTSQKLAEYLVKYYIDKPREQVVMILLDNSCRIIRVCPIDEGSPSSVRLDVRKMMECVLKYNAASVVLAHNHPRGDCQPSRADIMLTTNVRDLLQKIDVKLVDHIIIAEEQWMSLAASQVVSLK